jgi:hypothetical protein
MGEVLKGNFREDPEFQIPVTEYDPSKFKRDRTPEEKKKDEEDLEILNASVRLESMTEAKRKARARENGEIASPHVHTPNPKHLEDLDDRSN